MLPKAASNVGYTTNTLIRVREYGCSAAEYPFASRQGVPLLRGSESRGLPGGTRRAASIPGRASPG
jgi:hypothetical protein